MNGSPLAATGDQITSWLQSWQQGDQTALDQLIEAVYSDLRKIAARRLSQESGNHTLHPTDLVHDVFLRLADSNVDWAHRSHFFAVVATTMRRALVDHARAKGRAKRGGGALRVTLTARLEVSSEANIELLDLDAALNTLAQLDERQARIVDLYYFAGLTLEEIGKAVELSTPSVHRSLRSARAWIHLQLDQPPNRHSE